jgi:Tol biopolymer transport system component
VSSGNPGGQANGPSCEFSPLDDEVWEPPCISGDGRYVVFSSSASNLVSGDTNGLRDIFVRDRVAHTTIRASVSSSEEQSNGLSCYPSISADGAHIVFVSTATNLVSGDTNGAPDVFLRDLVTGDTHRVNLSSAGAQATGQRVWSSIDNDITARISGDGLHVAFASSATNLVPGDTNDTYDMFVRDINSSNHGSGVTERVSVSTSGQQGNGFCWGNLQTISYDGSVVV